MPQGEVEAVVRWAAMQKSEVEADVLLALVSSQLICTTLCGIADIDNLTAD